MRLEEQISEGIKQAMKAQDKARLAALRNVKKYIIEAKTAGTEIAELPDAEVIRIIQKLCKQGQDSAAIYQEQKRDDLYNEEMGQVNVLKEFLPKQMDDAELTEAIRGIIARTGATSMKEMGKVMGIATKELAGRADGKEISNKVKALLA
ncbi:GatB/YqeY domain-containing protein [Gallalistipes aquisgranensis]|uniref:GatB/YqeY domain-containing protein n=1 Tax=Gallalistipes aquisgranensis TaxID=2779358 RepID=UPI001CF81BBD|nr:GatB/YqeY domain-containing protein [Gallalistipes aquisgranensis]MBE5033230.1 GatB/YqeY domain-containing protein [Gallalistipes aquisgranensis]